MRFGRMDVVVDVVDIPFLRNCPNGIVCEYWVASVFVDVLDFA